MLTPSRFLQLGRGVALAIGLVILGAGPTIADQTTAGSDPAVSFYAPSADEDTQLSHTQAVILSYAIGDRYGEIDIRDGNGQTIRMLIGGDLLVEGHSISCMQAPQPGDDVNEVMCPDWPSDIVLHHTLVTLTYWKDRLNYQPIFVVSKIAVTRGPFVP